MSGEGKRYLIKKAQENAANYFKLDPSSQAFKDNTFVGTVSADFSLITDDNTGAIYNLQYTGNPQPKSLAYRLDSQTAFVQGVEFPQQSLWQENSNGLILARDTIWWYIRQQGKSKKYYLPVTDNLIGRDFKLFQGLLSSDGKAAMLGTVVQNSDLSYPTTVLKSVAGYHQIARYAIFKNFQLVDYTTSALTDLPVQGITYPVAKDQGFSIAYVAFNNVVTNSFDLNTYSDGFVPAPQPQTYAARGIFYPYSKSTSNFFNFYSLVNMSWEAESLPGVLYDTGFGSVFTIQAFGTKSHKGNENSTWVFTPNSSIFENYKFTFNNDKNGNYNADLVVTFVNAYLAGLTDYNWTTNFFWDQHNHGIPSGSLVYDEFFKAHYSETRQISFTYAYPADFAYNMRYLATPDVWVPVGDITATKITDTWSKNIDGAHSAVTNYGGAGASYDFTMAGQWDAIANVLVSSSGPLSDILQFAYYTGYEGNAGLANNITYDSKDTLILNYYNDKIITYKPYFGFGWANAYIYFGSSSFFQWCDLNNDQLFHGANADSPAVFAGRSSMVINNLVATPALYGIVTQPLGDGADFNNLGPGAFRGRDFTDNSNTAFIYKQDFNQFYKYSSPWLAQGNLSNIQGTGQISLQDPTTDPYTDAIVQLVDWMSLADALDDQPLVGESAALITVYRSQTTPSDASVRNVVNDLIALNSDFSTDALKMQSTLLGINAALNGGAPVLIGPDIIGYELPDIFTDKIFSAKGTWPFAQPGGGSLKAVDSYIVQGYYIDITNGASTETIQGYNVDTTGLTTKGKRATKPLPTVANESIQDYVLPIKASATLG